MRDGGILLVLRAAAVLIIATGVNDVIAGALPLYEPLYVYLGAIALVVWFDGVIAGAGAAVFATAFYALLFMPAGTRLAQPVLIPLGASFGVVLVTGAIRAWVRTRRREKIEVFPLAAAPQQLLTPIPSLRQDMTEVLDAIASLRVEIRSATASHDDGALHRALDAAHQAHDLERIRAEQEASLRQRLTADLDASDRRAEAAAAEAKSSAERAGRSERALQTALLRADTAVAAQQEAQRTLSARIAELEGSLALERTRHEKTTEVEEDSRRSLAARVAEFEQLLDLETKEVERLEARIGELEQMLATERGRASGSIAVHEDAVRTLNARVVQLEGALARERADAHTARAQLAETREAERARANRSTAAHEESQRALTGKVVELEARLATLADHELPSVVEARDAARAEVRVLSEKLAAAESDAAHARTQLLAAREAYQLHATRTAEHEESQRVLSATVAGLQTKLQNLADHELRDAVEERDAALAEARSLSEKVAAVEAGAASARAQLAEVREAEIENARRLSAAHDEAQRALTVRIGELESLLASQGAAAELARAELEQLLQGERDAAAAAKRQHETELQSLAQHPASGLETDLREAIQERDAAREETLDLTARLAALETEAANTRGELQRAFELERARASSALVAQEETRRGLHARVEELERLLEEEREAAVAARREQDAKLQTLAEHEANLSRAIEEREIALAEVRELTSRLTTAQRESVVVRAEVEVARQEAEAARAALEQVQSEFDTRVQTLAEHLASDHEADLGKAIEEREIARAEMRGLTSRLTTAHDEVAVARAELETARQEAAAARAELEEAQSEFDTRVQTLAEHLASDHEADLGKAIEERETARAEMRALSSRLTTAQQDLVRARGEVDAARQEAEASLAASEESRRHLETKLQTLAAQLAAAQEATGQSMTEEREAAQAEVRSLTSRLTMAQHEAVSARTQLEKLQKEFDEKLQTVVDHLASDHEADLGKALEEREAARAESRSFSQRLSTAQQELERMGLRLEQLRAASTAAEGKTRILVAHPDPDMRAAARTSLERAGYEIVIAADGLEALRKAIAARPAIVIADAIMPKMNGRELCQLLKSQEKTAHIRVILLTRATDDPPKGELPPDEVLRKPVPLEVLKATLAQMVGKPQVPPA